jgi:hypothetical protein
VNDAEDVKNYINNIRNTAVSVERRRIFYDIAHPKRPDIDWIPWCYRLDESNPELIKSCDAALRRAAEWWYDSPGLPIPDELRLPIEKIIDDMARIIDAKTKGERK